MTGGKKRINSRLDLKIIEWTETGEIS